MRCPKCGEVHETPTRWCRSCGAEMVPEPEVVRADAPVGVKPFSYLLPAILVTLFCCQPLGIAAIVFAAISMGRSSAGDYVGAQSASNVARLLCLIAVGVGLVWVAVCVAIMLAGIRAGA